MIFRVYSEDFEGFENKEEFNDEQEAIEAAKNNSKTGNYKKVIAVKENSDDPRFPEEEIIWSSDNISEDIEDDFEVEEKENIDKPYNDGLNVGDRVTIQGLAEDSPWEGLEGEVIWIDEEDFGDDFQTITVRVNFPTENGVKEINQNFDRKNVIKSEAPVETEEPVEEPEPEPEPRPTEEPDLYDSANEGLEEGNNPKLVYKCSVDNKYFVSADPQKIKDKNPETKNVWILIHNADGSFVDYEEGKKSYMNNVLGDKESAKTYSEQIKAELLEEFDESLKNGKIESREDAIIDKLIAKLRNDYGLEGKYLYNACLDAGMTEEEVKAFVISPEEFGESLNEDEDEDMKEKEKVEIEEPVETPVEEPEAEVETEVEVETEEPTEEPEIEEPIEEPVEEPTEEEPEEKPVQTIELPHEEYTEPEDIKRINDELGIKAQEGKVLGIRKENNILLLAEPEINGIWAIYLNEEGYIKKIVLF